MRRRFFMLQFSFQSAALAEIIGIVILILIALIVI